jgi:hypothetical protein
MDLFQTYSIGGDERVNIMDVAVVEGDGAGTGGLRVIGDPKMF